MAIAWRRDLDAAVEHAPTVTSDAVYVGTANGSVYALSGEDGTTNWSFGTGRAIQESPLVARGLVFVVSGDVDLGSNHTVYAIDATSGEKRWTFRPEEWWLEVFGVRDGLLYVGSSDDALSEAGQTLYALAIDDGTIEWTGEIGDASGGIVDDGGVYVPTYGRLYAYDFDVSRRWTQNVSDYSHATIAATEDVVCVVTEVNGSRGVLQGLSTDTGEPIWRFEDWLVTSTALHGDVLYAGGERLAAFEPSTGSLRWESVHSGFLHGAPADEEQMYAGGGAVRAHSLVDGDETWSWRPDAPVQILLPTAVRERSVYVDAIHDDDPRHREKYVVQAGGDRYRRFGVDTELTDLAVGRERGFVGGADGIVYALDA